MGKARLLLAVAAAALALAACGNSSSGGSASSIGSGQTGSRGGQAFSQPGAAGVPPAADQAAAQALPGPRVQRTARVQVRIKHGAFDSSLDQLYQLVQDEGGFISGTNSDSQAAGGGERSAVYSFQVPADKFQATLNEVRRLGTVEHIAVSGNDVSSQYVDLQSRLKNAQAQRDAMLGILQQARSIQDMIQIQNQLGQIEGQIEQIEGQINYLDHTTQNSTITVVLGEAAPAPVAGDTWGFQTALITALHQFVASVDTIVVALGAVGPFLLVLLGAGLLAWRLRGRRAARTAA